MILGVLIVLVAAFLQGTFLVPMALTRKWKWDHSWAVFSLTAMLFLNWAFAAAVLPNPVLLYRATAPEELLTLALFGAGWGVGAVLFGLGMDRLGLTLGYPLIMGLNAAAGTLVPLVFLTRASLLSPRSLTVAAGTALALSGIVVCSLAAARKNASAPPEGVRHNLRAGLLIAIAAGLLSCLPNIGMAYGKGAVAAAVHLGAPPSAAGNAVWAVFFTFGGFVNLAYCGRCMARNRNFVALCAPGSLRNAGLIGLMSLMWIGSFYLYGAGAARLGAWGAVIGWPVFIAVSIGVGILWGLWKGEWTGAPHSAIHLLQGGLALLLVSVITLALGNSL